MHGKAEKRNNCIDLQLKYTIVIWLLCCYAVFQWRSKVLLDNRITG